MPLIAWRKVILLKWNHWVLHQLWSLLQLNVSWFFWEKKLTLMTQKIRFGKKLSKPWIIQINSYQILNHSMETILIKEFWIRLQRLWKILNILKIIWRVKIMLLLVYVYGQFLLLLIIEFSKKLNPLLKREIRLLKN